MPRWPENAKSYQVWKEKRLRTLQTLNVYTFWIRLHPGLELILSLLDRASLVSLADATNGVNNELGSILDWLYSTSIRNPFDVRTTLRRVNYIPEHSMRREQTPWRRTYCFCDECTFGTLFLEEGVHYYFDDRGNIDFKTKKPKDEIRMKISWVNKVKGNETVPFIRLED